MSTDNTYYTQAGHGPFETHDIGTLVLEEGGSLRNCTLAYATFGTLNAARDNAVLVTTWYTGTSKIMEQLHVGTGRALDPAKFFIIIVNQIGSGLSSSPSNTAVPFNGPHFPSCCCLRSLCCCPPAAAGVATVPTHRLRWLPPTAPTRSARLTPEPSACTL